LAFNSAQQKAHRAKLKELGICTRCHKEPVERNSVCSKCIAYVNESRTRKRKDITLCKECLVKMDEFSIARGDRHCQPCLDRRNDSRQRIEIIKGWSECR